MTMWSAHFTGHSLTSPKVILENIGKDEVDSQDSTCSVELN